MSWFRVIEEAALALSAPIDVFFRVDDGGWNTPALLRLSSIASRHAIPLDIAMIPAETDARLVETLLDYRAAGHALGFHQHGFAHINHEAEGRKCEFGPTRTSQQQRDDIRRGRDRLMNHFGGALDPVFTPPWNRCSDAAIEALIESGILAISTDRPRSCGEERRLKTLPVACDWQRKKQGVRVDRGTVAEDFASTLRRTQTPVGIMLHHAALTDVDWNETEQLFETIARLPTLNAKLMKQLLGGQYV